jgi:nuclear factor related to kappa-B-binding protein
LIEPEVLQKCLEGEFVQYQGEYLSLPFEILSPEVFRTIFSVETWNECLSEQEKLDLMDLLPEKQFASSESLEALLHTLFEGGICHFNNPLTQFYNQLNGKTSCRFFSLTFFFVKMESLIP